MRSISADLRERRRQDLGQVAELWRRLGHTPGSITVYCNYVWCILEEFGQSDYTQLCANRVVQRSLSYARRHQIDAKRCRWMWLSTFRAFAWGLMQLGKAVGSVELHPRAAPAQDPVMLAFIHYTKELGCSQSTLRGHLRNLNGLRRFLIRRHAPWPIPRLRDIDHFLLTTRKQWSRSTVGVAAGSCRTWLRFLFVTGRIKEDLSASVALPPSVSYPRPARALPWSTVRQLHRGIDTSTPLGKRDEAQYLLLCAYGLSNAELTNLKVEDIDWQTGVLHIRRVKNGATVDLPLLDAVAIAIGTYLRDGRPETPCHCLFVRHAIPFGPLSKSTIAARVQCWAKRSHVKVTRLGVHVFRHSFATTQLEQGMPLKVIGDILGHQDCKTTSVYVRSAVERLRPLALPVPK
jgi:integrase/recombinase XerD